VEKPEECETHLGGALTAYCFGESSDAESAAIEQHLFVCDRCWDECRRLSQAVGILRAGNALPAPFVPGEIVSVLGISSRLTDLLQGILSSRPA
jgi:anti-sigma factor RsiW